MNMQLQFEGDEHMKKQLLIFGITLVLLTIGLSGCVEEENESNGKETSDSLSNLGYKQYGFGMNPPEKFRFAHFHEIGVPEYWYVNESILGCEVIFELEDSSLTKMNASLSITRLKFVKNNEPVPRHVFNNCSLENYASENMKYFYDMFTNITYISNTTYVVNGMNAYESIFTGRLNGENVTRMNKQKFVYVEKNDATFMIVYSATEDLYDEYIDVANESINSFTIQ
jgi:hypothetical protein